MPADASILEGPFVAAVSRSFYLSLRFLPPSVRTEITLAYLLARVTDTIADSAHAPTSHRLALLEQFPSVLSGHPAPGFFCEVATLAHDLQHPGEQALLSHLPQVAGAFLQLEVSAQLLVREVLQRILRGQSLDLQRFSGRVPAALVSPSELEEYTWLVAGCVGEFWSSILDLKVPAWSRLPLAEMKALGRAYGEGLQLVNILRDLPADLAHGRCYLPMSELRTAGFSGDFATWESQRETFQFVRNQWVEVAQSKLAAGRSYTAALRTWRLRLTAGLPWRIGTATLAKLLQSPLHPTERIKVSRLHVYQLLMAGIVHAVRG